MLQFLVRFGVNATENKKRYPNTQLHDRLLFWIGTDNNKQYNHTVHVYVVIHFFFIVCGLFEWNRICADFCRWFICIAVGDLIIRRGSGSHKSV